MLSKEQLESRANQIREYVKGNDRLVDEQIKVALENANALEEVISLREQLAELKALQPVGQIVLSDYGSDGTRTARVVCLHDQADWDNFQDGTLLFTAAKPAGENNEPM